MVKISFAIITRNAEATLEKCLNSIQDLADEIVVLDSGSADRTKQIAEERGARFFQQEFSSFSVQKNQAAARCTNQWVFSIDADECLSPRLCQSLLQWKKETHEPGVFAVKRLNHIKLRPIRHAGWYPDIKPRLYHRQEAQWTGGKVHEKLEAFHPQPVSLLEGDLHHFPFNTFEEHLQKTERYALLAAEDKTGKPLPLLMLLSLVSPLFKFFKMYFLQKGFLDGTAGWWICRAAFRETRLKYRHAIRLKHSTK